MQKLNVHAAPVPDSGEGAAFNRKVMVSAIIRPIRNSFKRARVPGRWLRQGLTEDERYLVADNVVRRLQQHGDPWGLSEELSEIIGKGHSTAPVDKQ